MISRTISGPQKAAQKEAEGVASTSRRAYAVTFTAVASASTAVNANNQATALASNIAPFNTATAAVKAANTAYSSVTVPTASSAAAATATTAAVASPSTVSGAAALSTSIMAMAVAALAALQVRQ